MMNTESQEFARFSTLYDIFQQRTMTAFEQIDFLFI